MNDRKIESLFFFLLLLIASALIVFMFLPYLDSIVLSIASAIVFFPLYSRIRRLVKSSWLSSLLCTFIVFAFIFGPLIFFGASIFNEARSAYESLSQRPNFNLDSSFPRSVAEKIQPLLNDAKISLDTQTFARQFLVWLTGHLGEIFASISKLLFMIFLSLFILFYLFLDGEKLLDKIALSVPMTSDHTRLIFERLKSMITAVIRGSLIIAIIQGVMEGAGFFIFGIPNPVLWGTVTIIAALVPTFGTSLVLAPAVVYLFLTGKTSGAIGLLLWGGAMVGLIDNVLSPYLVRHGTNIHPLLILLSVLGGISLFGPIGLIAGPMVLSLLLVLLEIYPSVAGIRKRKAARFS